MAGAITIEIAYGVEIQSENDPYLEIAEQALVGLAAAAAPGAFLVDSIPILKYVPEWMPGAGWKRKAKEWCGWTMKLLEVPFAAAQREIVSASLHIQSHSAYRSRHRRRERGNHLSYLCA